MRDYTEELNQAIQSHDICVLYFYNNHCAPCRVLRPKLEYMLKHKHPDAYLEQVDAGIFTRVSSQFDVYAAPVIILFAMGREYRRYSKFISLDELDAELERLKILME